MTALEVTTLLEATEEAELCVETAEGGLEAGLLTTTAVVAGLVLKTEVVV